MTKRRCGAVLHNDSGSDYVCSLKPHGPERDHVDWDAHWGWKHGETQCYQGVNQSARKSGVRVTLGDGVSGARW